MNIAELFVNLGIKGSEQTVGALGSVRKGLGEVTSMSLEAKAAILAALYGLEQMAAKSGATGTGLTNFAALTGLSAKTLQQWQYAARQAGISGEELTGSLKNVQNAMTNIRLNKGAPEGFAIVKNAVGLDTSRLKDTFYVLGQLQKAAQALPQDVGNSVLKSFGLSEGTIAAMRRNAFNASTLLKAPLYSDSEIGSLNKSNIAWSNLGNKIEMAFGHFNAKHGLQLVTDIDKITTAFFRLTEQLENLNNKWSVLETAGHLLEGIANTLKLISEIVDKLGGKDSKKGDLLYVAPGEEAVPGLSNSPAGKFFKTIANDRFFGGTGDALKELMSPSAAAQAPQVHYTSHITQTITHHGDAKDTKAVKDLHKHSINNAFRQRAAQRQGS